MKLVPKGKAVLLGLVLLVTVGTGCRVLRELWSHICGGVNCTLSGCTVSVCPRLGSTCTPCRPSGAGAGLETINVPANYRPATTLWSTLAGAVDNGTTVDGIDFCYGPCSADPESPECDACRTSVEAATFQPFYSLCVGAIYAPPPDQILGKIHAFTDRREYISAPILARRRGGTVRYDDCGAGINNNDYDLDPQPTQQFSTFVVNQGATQLNATVYNQQEVGGADNSQPLIALKPEFKQMILEGRAGEINAADTVVRASGWPFQGGGGDLTLGPGQFDGAYLTTTAIPSIEDLTNMAVGGGFSFDSDGIGGLKPCRNDTDCIAWGLVCRPSAVDGLVCTRP